MEFCRIHLDEVDSTNNYAAKWIGMTKSIIPAVITARFQHQGKGQRQNQWTSPKDGNLTCSFILFPQHLGFDQIALFNKCIANATHQTLAIWLKSELSIKWPNDLWVGNKKIAGILIENGGKSQSIAHSIAGIGININQSFLPEDPWCSLYSIQGNKHAMCEILDPLEKNIAEQLIILQEKNYSRIEEYYHRYLLKKDEVIRFVHQQVSRQGKFIKVDQWGRVIIECQGEQLHFNHGEVVIEYR